MKAEFVDVRTIRFTELPGKLTQEIPGGNLVDLGDLPTELVVELRYKGDGNVPPIASTSKCRRTT